MANEPITEGISFEINNEPITEGISSESENADKQKLQELIKMAEDVLLRIVCLTTPGKKLAGALSLYSTGSFDDSRLTATELGAVFPDLSNKT